MPFTFKDPKGHEYGPGMLFLGRDNRGNDIGLPTDRHAIAIAGARSGKGAALIIPNLLRWRHNVLCIDPSGENVEATWEAREGMGQTVRVIDPFKVANVPDRLRASCNLLASIKAESLTAREDIRVIADGLVMRHKAEDATWDNGAVSVLAGVIAYVLGEPSATDKTLPVVRSLLVMPDDARQELFKAMAESTGFGNLARAAAAIGLSDTKKNREFVGGAVDHSEWLDSDGMTAILSGSTFDLSELKTGNTSVFLVLPPEYLSEHGRFLRLFVRAALNAMTKGGKTGNRCLFLLDEFYSLGHIDQIAKAAGLLPKNGVHLWPFLQDLGQLVSLYGREGAHTFFGNADAHIFFGNTDEPTLSYVSQMLGILTAAEVGAAPVNVRLGPSSGHGVAMFLGGSSNNHTTRATAHMTGAMVAGMSNLFSSIGDALAQSEYNEWQQKASMVGRPRISPEEVRNLVGKRTGQAVAASMIVFAKAGDVFNLQLAPYFQPAPVPQPTVKGRLGKAAVSVLTGAPKVPAKQYRRFYTFKDVLMAACVIAAYWVPWWFCNEILLGIKNASFGRQQGVWVGQPALILFMICVSLNVAFYYFVYRNYFKGTFSKFKRIEIKPEPKKENPA